MQGYSMSWHVATTLMNHYQDFMLMLLECYINAFRLQLRCRPAFSSSLALSFEGRQQLLHVRANCLNSSSMQLPKPQRVCNCAAGQLSAAALPLNCGGKAAATTCLCCTTGSRCHCFEAKSQTPGHAVDDTASAAAAAAASTGCRSTSFGST
jgi:hypothetical protein